MKERAERKQVWIQHHHHHHTHTDSERGRERERAKRFQLEGRLGGGLLPTTGKGQTALDSQRSREGAVGCLEVMNQFNNVFVLVSFCSRFVVACRRKSKKLEWLCCPCAWRFLGYSMHWEDSMSAQALCHQGHEGLKYLWHYLSVAVLRSFPRRLNPHPQPDPGQGHASLGQVKCENTNWVRKYTWATYFTQK